MIEVWYDVLGLFELDHMGSWPPALRQWFLVLGEHLRLLDDRLVRAPFRCPLDVFVLSVDHKEATLEDQLPCLSLRLYLLAAALVFFELLFPFILVGVDLYPVDSCRLSPHPYPVIQA